MPVTLNRLLRISRNIATGADEVKEYPARAVEIRNRALGPILAWKPRAAADRLIEMFWNGLPPRVRSGRYAEQLGRRIHRRARRIHARGGGCYTLFLRNVPQLELIRDLVLQMPTGAPVKIASVGCSTGAELYSALWVIRKAQPKQRVQGLGIDISDQCIRAASRAVYPFRVTEVTGLTETSYERLFTRVGKTLVVQDWVKEAVTWEVGDACSSDLAARFGLHDVVIANNFLFHMAHDRAEACLRNLARLVAPKGYLVVSGVDLDLRSSVLADLGFVPVTTRYEEIHTAEDTLPAWPLLAWGLEPIDRTRPDAAARYATAFQAPANTAGAAP